MQASAVRRLHRRPPRTPPAHGSARLSAPVRSSPNSTRLATADRLVPDTDGLFTVRLRSGASKQALPVPPLLDSIVESARRKHESPRFLRPRSGLSSFQREMRDNIYVSMFQGPIRNDALTDTRLPAHFLMPMTTEFRRAGSPPDPQSSEPPIRCPANLWSPGSALSPTVEVSPYGVDRPITRSGAGQSISHRTHDGHHACRHTYFTAKPQSARDERVPGQILPGTSTKQKQANVQPWSVPVALSATIRGRGEKTYMFNSSETIKEIGKKKRQRSHAGWHQEGRTGLDASKWKLDPAEVQRRAEAILLTEVVCALARLGVVGVLAVDQQTSPPAYLDPAHCLPGQQSGILSIRGAEDKTHCLVVLRPSAPPPVTHADWDSWVRSMACSNRADLAFVLPDMFVTTSARPHVSSAPTVSNTAGSTLTFAAHLQRLWLDANGEKRMLVCQRHDRAMADSIVNERDDSSIAGTIGLMQPLSQTRARRTLREVVAVTFPIGHEYRSIEAALALFRLDTFMHSPEMDFKPTYFGPS